MIYFIEVRYQRKSLEESLHIFIETMDQDQSSGKNWVYCPGNR